MNPLSSKPTYLDYRSTNGMPARRPAPNGPAPAQQQQQQPTAPTNGATTLHGAANTSSLLVYISGSASPSLSTHLNTLLRTQRIRETILIGPREDVLKNLRTEVYTAAGRLRQDVVVTMKISDAENLEAVVKGVVKRGLLGCLVCEWEEAPTGLGIGTEGEQEVEPERDVLELGHAELEGLWRSSVLPLHALLRHTLPLLSASTSSSPTSTPFFYLDVSPTPSFTSTSRTALLTSISTSPYARNVTIGPASEHLIPPTLSETQSTRSLQVDTNNANWEAYGHVTPDGSPIAAESPTKLWASWAAQNDYF